LVVDETSCSCARQHTYAVVRGIPVMLRDDTVANHDVFYESLAAENNEEPAALPLGAIDPFVQSEIVKTNGNLYRDLRGRLTRYPIPRFPVADGANRKVLDLGCSWGRWCVAAERAGFHAVGIDPSLRAVEAAQRVARQMGVAPEFLVSDARSLPFPNESFDLVFSYSVLQHFSHQDVYAALKEAERVLKPGGTILIQMANILGPRQMYNQIVDLIRRERKIFRVRRWLPWHILTAFREIVGPTTLEPDGFFTLNPQLTDVDILPPFSRFVVRLSSRLCQISADVPPLRFLADSVFVEAKKSV
jgi:SAM-dependent methyltransferase